MTYPILYWTATAFVLVNIILNLALLLDRPDSYARLHWRQKVAAEIRRHPFLRAVQLICSVLALTLYLIGSTK